MCNFPPFPSLPRLWAMKSHVHFIFHKYYRPRSLSVTHFAKNHLSKARVPGQLLPSGFLQTGFPAGINNPHHPEQLTEMMSQWESRAAAGAQGPARIPH